MSKLLSQYSANLATPAAIKRAFDVEVDEFERGYREYVVKIVATIALDRAVDEPTLAMLETQHQAEPENRDIAARLAVAYVENDQPQKARHLANQILQQVPKHQTAVYVVARLKLRAGETDAAVEVLENGLDREKPDRRLLTLLAGLKLKQNDRDAAAALYELGSQKYPNDLQWTQALARVYLQSENDEKLAPVLVRLAESDADNLSMRQKLALLAAKRGDHAEAERWSREAIHIDANNADMHRTLAEALLAQKNHRQAAAAYEIAKLADPRDTAVRAGLIRALVADNQRERAAVELNAFEQLSPDHSEIEPLRELVRE